MIAADDGTPIDAATDSIVATVQVRARSPRGFADQSQPFAPWSSSALTVVNLAPAIGIATNDGSGQLTLASGLLTINVPTSIMAQLRAGFYQVGITLSNADAKRQIAIGLLPIYDGGVFS